MMKSSSSLPRIPSAGSRTETASDINLDHAAPTSALPYISSYADTAKSSSHKLARSMPIIAESGVVVQTSYVQNEREEVINDIGNGLPQQWTRQQLELSEDAHRTKVPST
jgi:hypothetical protein